MHTDSKSDHWDWSGGLAWDTEATLWAASVASSGDFRWTSLGLSVESTVVSSSTSATMGFELGDEELDDYFVVEVLRDPTYGTMMFNLMKGASSCGHEDRTEYRARPSLIVKKAPYAAVESDQPAIFVVEISNNADTSQDDESDLVLELDTQSVEHGLQVSADGEGLFGGKVYRRFPGRASLDVTVEVRRGPRKFIYTAPRLRVRQECPEPETGEVSSWVSLSTGPDQQIRFLHPCSTVAFSGELHAEGSFLINSQQKAAGFLVRAKNPLFSIRPWGNDTRLEWVRLQYRLRGETGATSWRFGRGVGSHILELRDKETNAGIAEALWEAPRHDGFYEIRLQTRCSASLSPEYDESTSSTVLGRVDRTPPRVLRRSTRPMDALLLPGDEISATFSEEIDCEGIGGTTSSPLAVAMQIGEALQLKYPNFTVDCYGSVLKIQSVPWSVLVGHTVVVQVFGVADLAGNTLAAPTNWSFSVPAPAGQVQLQGIIVAFPLFDALPDNFPAAAVGQISSALGVPPSTLLVQNLRPAPSGKGTTFDIIVEGTAHMPAIEEAERILTYLEGLSEPEKGNHGASAVFGGVSVAGQSSISFAAAPNPLEPIPHSWALDDRYLTILCIVLVHVVLTVCQCNGTLTRRMQGSIVSPMHSGRLAMPSAMAMAMTDPHDELGGSMAPGRSLYWQQQIETELTPQADEAGAYSWPVAPLEASDMRRPLSLRPVAEEDSASFLT